jgi:hypothetical protein
MGMQQAELKPCAPTPQSTASSRRRRTSSRRGEPRSWSYGILPIARGWSAGGRGIGVKVKNRKHPATNRMIERSACHPFVAMLSGPTVRCRTGQYCQRPGLRHEHTPLGGFVRNRRFYDGPHTALVVQGRPSIYEACPRFETVGRGSQDNPPVTGSHKETNDASGNFVQVADHKKVDQYDSA